jgi:excisionase family DNA binding protein
MAKPNYSHWPTKQQAAETIGISTKTLEKLAADKLIQQASWKRPETGANVRVYNPDDVNRIRLERNPEASPFVMPPESPAPKKAKTDTRSTALAIPHQADQFLRALASMSQNSQKSDVRISERLFLKIPEASEYTGLPQSDIRRMMAEGKIEGRRTGAGWRIRRADLEKI